MAKKSSGSELGLEHFKGFIFGDDDGPSELIPCGHADLDYNVSKGILEDFEDGVDRDETKIGGFPAGRLVMMYGGEGCGKSSLAYRTCGYAQRMGKLCIWIDAENSFSPQLARINGVDVHNKKTWGMLRMYNPDNPDALMDGETIMDRIMSACRGGAGVVVLDSVASIVPKVVMEAESDQETRAILARLISRTINKIASYAAAHGTLVIFINQLRIDMNVKYGDPETFPGGKALAHACSVILKMTKVKSKDSLMYIENDEGTPELVAGQAYVRFQKNRFAPPYVGSLTIPIYYKNYFPAIEEVLFNIGRQTKTISVRTGVYSWDKLKVKGRKEFIQALKDSGKTEELVEEIRAAAQKQEIILPPEVLHFDKHKAFSEKNKDKIAKARKKQAEAAASSKAAEVDEDAAEREEAEKEREWMSAPDSDSPSL